MLSNAIAWMARTRLQLEIFVYVDDFVILSSSETAEQDLLKFLELLKTLGVPVAEDKLRREGAPSTTKTYLGLEFDLERDRIRLPHDKRVKLIETLQLWLKSSKRRATDFRRLAGSLAWASLATPYGRAFTHSVNAAIPAGQRGGVLQVSK
jgi:hypothetical protein